jgi:hypothetical protein
MRGNTDDCTTEAPDQVTTILATITLGRESCCSLTTVMSQPTWKASNIGHLIDHLGLYRGSVMDLKLLLGMSSSIALLQHGGVLIASKLRHLQ